MTRPIPGGSTFCGKCRKHEAGGTGSGRKYRCPRCSANRLASLLTSDYRNHAARGKEAS